MIVRLHVAFAITGKIAAFLFWNEPHSVNSLAIIIQDVLTFGVQVDRPADAVYELTEQSDTTWTEPLRTS